jgi:hypothetical protein
MDKKLKKLIDFWENRTHIWVAFDLVSETIHLEGEFTDNDLSEIASIQRKILKKKKAVSTVEKQRSLFNAT